MLARLEQLPHPAVFDLVRDAELVSPMYRFGFNASVHRHYERLPIVPAGFLCIGDAICSFNPVWGQGMSVAALEVLALGRLLELGADPRAGAELPRAFYAEAARIIETPWALSVGPDLAYASTRAERKPEQKAANRFSRALGRLAFQDAEVRSLTQDVYHLIKPREALMSPELLGRVASLISPS
jgi:2-polyprenyl-6-methoxyphenol hydroxylase-like FAD-dependent oxidoreductase